MTLILCSSHFYSCYNIKPLFYWRKNCHYFKGNGGKPDENKPVLNENINLVHEASQEERLQMCKCC